MKHSAARPAPSVIACGDIDVAADIRGDGPPVLLLHGYPQNRVMWDDVATALAETRTVVAADLRGYGDSSKPAGDRYSKREMADDQIALMAKLGFDRFAVIGHDRGARVGHRLALDNPDAITGLAVLDIVPTLHMFEHVDRAMASSYFHWFLLARDSGLPEALIEAAPTAWLRSRFAGRSLSGAVPSPEAYAEYERCFDTATIRASCADYRAAASIDLEHDRADRAAGRMLEMPLLALWGSSSYVGSNFDVLDVWRQFAVDVAGEAVVADHYLAEEAPVATGELLGVFLDARVAS